MTCIDPPELTDLQLAMYLDDDADSSVHSHLIRCAYCRGRAKEQAQTHNSLRVALHRASCPDTDTLQDYQFGFLSGHETGAVELHLHTCPHCTHHLASLREYIADMAWIEEFEAEEPDRLQRIRWFLADVVKGSPTLAPSLAGVRGGEDESSAAYEGGEFRIDTAVRVDTKIPEQRVLVGSVLGPAIDSDEAAGRWSADLWLDQKWLATESVDDLGSFRFTGLRPGNYELIINGPDTKIRVPVVAVE